MRLDLRRTRARRGWSQAHAAERLGLSQPYLSLLERGKRRLTAGLVRRLRRVYRLPPTVLPATPASRSRGLADQQTVAEDLGALGYPGFAYLAGRRHVKNPCEVLLTALALDDLEPRLTEALPWLLFRYGEGLDQDWLVEQAKLNDLQNRLGFVVTLARELAEGSPRLRHLTRWLRALETTLERSRLAKEDTLCEALLPEAKRRWLRENRPPEAVQWNLLTAWRPEHVRYVT